MRARTGDSDALQRVCKHLEPSLRDAAEKKLGRLRTKVGLSDVLQSTFIDIVRSAKSLPAESKENLEHWSLRVLDNNIKDLARYFDAEKRDRKIEAGLGSTGFRAIADELPSPASELIQNEEFTKLALAISTLPADYQRILHLFLRPDFSHESAAQTLGRSEGASRILLARARAALLAALDEQST